MANFHPKMPGKAYSMKELKAIVDYLIDHDAYGETKARKMWMDYANSGLTNRTWQSLKETFLKRILPNIHNPYYKLTMDQIRSFRTGVDVTSKPANKLLFEVFNEELQTDEIINEQPSTSNNDHNNLSGEDKPCSKVSSSRESVETFIIGTEECYDNAQELINDLEGVEVINQGLQGAPFNRVVKNIVDDFQSEADINDIDSRSDDPQSQSVLNDFDRCLVSEDVTGINKNVSEKNDVDSVVSKVVETQQNNDKPTQNPSLPDSLLPNNPEELQKEQKPKEPNVSQSPVKTGTDIGVEAKIKKHRKCFLNSSDKKEVKKKQKRLTLIKPIDDTANKKCRCCSPVNSSDMSNLLLNMNEKENTSDKIDSKLKKNVRDSTTNTKIVKHVRIANDDEIIQNTMELTNPCLQSVSLFEENLKSFETDSDISNTSNILENPEAKAHTLNSADKPVNNKKITSMKLTDAINEKLSMQKSEVVVLKSHSESDSEVEMQTTATSTFKLKKTKSLNNLFENLRGGLGNRRGKPYPVGSGNGRQTMDYSVSDSTEWTSESDGEYISPPRSRNRHARKCLKPSSSRILSLEQDGGLFVACGKKVYPIVKDGKMLKHFLKYMPESDTDENDSYWKVKYVEERKKTAELQRILENLNEDGVDKISNTLDSPILQSKTIMKEKGQTNGLDPDTIKTADNFRGNEIVLSRATEVRDDEKTVKIKFAKDNEEVFLEGHWQSIHPILPEVMQMFQREASFKIPTTEQRQPVDVHSGKSTPIIRDDYDEETRRKVDAIESRIFQEIEDIERSGHVSDPTSSGYMISRRKRGRPRKEFPSPSPPKAASPKRLLISEGTAVKEDDEIIVNENKLKLIDAEAETGAGVTTRVTARKQSKESYVENDTQTKDKEDDDDSSILYRFPSPEPKKWSARVMGKRTRSAQTSKKTYGMKLPRIYSSDNLVLQSESSQGYQDSDDSPFKYNLRRKKRLSISSLAGKLKYSYTRKTKTQKYFDWDASDESSNSSFNVRTKSITIHNSSLNTEAYRSESYQMLMPQSRSFRPLRRITESPCPNEICSPCDFDLSPASQNLEIGDKSVSNSLNTNLEIGNSSNVSLPLSPELSIVENISVNKSILPGSSDHPTINETQSHDSMDIGSHEKYVISKVDITMPLMSQTCMFESTQKKYVDSRLHTDEIYYSDSKDFTNVGEVTKVSEAVLDKSDADNLQENITVSESLEIKLKNMLLESAKKIAKQNKMTKLELEKDGGSTNVISKKRCSTPRKKTKNKQHNVIEECMEFCSSGRKSCPPVVTAIHSEKLPESSGNLPVETATKKKIRKAKKDIIKVKILKPKPKKIAKTAQTPTKNKKKASQISMFTDSGINDTTSSAFLRSLNDDVDLIHNHSETCLQANECLLNSVELIDKSNTIISLSTSSSLGENKENIRTSSNINIRRLTMTPDMFCTDARDATNLSSNASKSSNGDLNNLDVASLITEDLSDEPVPRPKSNDWYLLSEEEFTNTLCNTMEPAECTMKSGYGANLMKLFPIACAVPDLSTITEISRETDGNSCKSTLQDTYWSTK